jgi:DNA topoisomerase IB
VHHSEPGYTRRRNGRGFVFLDEGGRLIRDRRVQRLRSLVIPPAWNEVWICADDTGHLQATGTDDAGRRQYLYHPDWCRQRDRAKFERIERFAEALPALRERVQIDRTRRPCPAATAWPSRLAGSGVMPGRQVCLGRFDRLRSGNDGGARGEDRAWIRETC